MHHFSLAAIRFPLDCWCPVLDVPGHGFLQMYLFGVSGVSRSVNLCISPDLRIVSHYFFKYFSVPFSFSSPENPITHRVDIYVCHTGLWGAIPFFFLLSSLNLFSFGKKIPIDHCSGSLAPSPLFLTIEVHSVNFISNLLFSLECPLGSVFCFCVFIHCKCIFLTFHCVGLQ